MDSAIVPVRGLAAAGILRDPSPYELDLNAWSSGVNVRFHANKVERAPAFRTASADLPARPVFCASYEPSSGYDRVMVMGEDGTLTSYVAGVVSDVTETGHTTSTSVQAATSCLLGDVLYINQPGFAPRFYGPLATTFDTLPNMEAAWTCRSLRAFGDYLIALNVIKPDTWTDPHTTTTQTGGHFPNLFKWSDLTLYGQPPGSWDYLDPSTNAGENPLEELKTPLVDGLTMRNIFVIYTEDEVWAAKQTGDNAIFEWERLFSDGGMIAPNCAVEVNGIHYVFGPKDIYQHDGVSKRSIIDKRNKQTFFRYLNTHRSEVCFVAYLPHLDSVMFCCNSGDPLATYTTADRCNWAAVYDIPSDTWSFVDLPNVSAITMANLDNVLTYASAGGTTYASVGGAYYDQDNTFAKAAAACSATTGGAVTANRLLAYDFINKGTLTFPVEAECNPPAFVERAGISLDQLGSDLVTYKLVSRMYPQVAAYGGLPVQIAVGGANTPSGVPAYVGPISFDPETDYKIDVMVGGRYLSVKFTVAGLVDIDVVGYDLELTENGRR